MVDILLNSEYEFEIENGDFKTGESEAQDIRLLMDTSKGHWTENELVGVGLIRWKNGVLDAALEKEIQLQFEAAGLTGLEIDIVGNDIFITKN
jgi:hypothetical protein